MRNILSILFASLTLFSCSVNKSAEKQNTFCNPMNLDYGWGNFQTREKKAVPQPILLSYCLKTNTTCLPQWTLVAIAYLTI